MTEIIRTSTEIVKTSKTQLLRLRILDEEAKKGLDKRMRSSLLMVCYAIFCLIFAFLADPRHPNADTITHANIRGTGMAEFLPIWGNFIFGMLFILSLCGFSFQIGKELNNCFVKSTDKRIIWLIGTMILIPQIIPNFIMMYCVYWNESTSASELMIGIYGLGFLLAAFLWIPYYFIIKNSTNYNKFNAIFFPLISIFITWMFCGFFYLSIVRGWTTLVFIVLICILSDSFAYLSGTFFGQHKMAPKLSPKKTWEGLIGGVLLTIIFMMGIAVLYGMGDKYQLQGNILGNQWDMAAHSIINPGYINSNGTPVATGWGWWILIFVFICLVIAASVFGDLFFSYLKRKNGIKDFANFIPGHGGVLDRIDSWCVGICLSGLILNVTAFISGLVDSKGFIDRIFNVVNYI